MNLKYLMKLYKKHFFLELEIPRTKFEEELYLFSKNIIDYSRHKIDIEKFIRSFKEKKTKKILRKVLKRINYIYSHEILNWFEIFSFRELINKQFIKLFIGRYKKWFLLPINHYETSVFHYKCGLIFLSKRFRNLIKNKDFIDGGAFIGDSALVFEKFYQPKKIYAFEPGQEIFNAMLKTIQMNNLKRVIPIKKGLGEKEEILKFELKSSCSHVTEKGDQTIEIISIDDFVSKNNLNLGLIKMDIEGFEFNALKGAEKSIKIFKPILLISIYHDGMAFFETANFIQKISPYYKFIVRKLDPSKPFAETQLIAWYSNK